MLGAPTLPPACPAACRGRELRIGRTRSAEWASLGVWALPSRPRPSLSSLVQGEDGFPGFKGDMGIKGDRVSVWGRGGWCTGPLGGLWEGLGVWGHRAASQN